MSEWIARLDRINVQHNWLSRFTSLTHNPSLFDSIFLSNRWHHKMDEMNSRTVTKLFKVTTLARLNLLYILT